MSATVPPTPMCDRLAASSTAMESVVRFLTHCVTNGLHLCAESPCGEWQPVPDAIALVYSAYGIDVEALDAERRALIAHRDAEKAKEAN